MIYVKSESSPSTPDLPRLATRESPLILFRIFSVAAIFYLGGFLISSSLSTEATGDIYLRSTVYRTSLLLAFNISVSILGLIWLTKDGRSFLRHWFRTDGLLRDILYGLASGAALFAVFGILAAILQNGLPDLVGMGIHFKRPEFHVFSGRILKHLLSPIGEELFFRGLLFSILSSRYDIAKGMLASSLIFSAAHFTVLDQFSSANILRAIWFTINGLIYCELFRRRGNLYPAIFAHSAYNLLTSLFYIG